MTWWEKSSCGEYHLEHGPKGLYVVLHFSDGSSVFAQGDDSEILRQEWDSCAEAGDFSWFEEYRESADPPEVDA